MDESDDYFSDVAIKRVIHLITFLPMIGELHMAVWYSIVASNVVVSLIFFPILVCRKILDDMAAESTDGTDSD